MQIYVCKSRFKEFLSQGSKKIRRMVCYVTLAARV